MELIPGSKLSSWFGTEIEVNSYHHQGIRVEELAPPLRLSAFWESNEQKIVEGYEHPSLPILGVQWASGTDVGGPQSQYVCTLPVAVGEHA